MPGAGELDARVRFDARGEDANGDPLGDFVEGFTVWAKVQYLRGTEAAVANRLAGLQPVMIDVRDSSQTRAITSAMRAVVVVGRGVRPGEVLNITAVAPGKDLGFINVLATSGGAAG
jgi:head-tail adaptor